MSSKFLLALLFAALTTTTASAVDHNNWRTSPLPLDLVSGPDAIGTTVTLTTTSEFRIYSGITKEWIALPADAPGFLEQYNAYVVYENGNQLYGYASRRTAADALTVSPSRTITSGPLTSSWVTIVVDGNTAYGFSGFRGEWIPLPLSTSTPEVKSTGICGLLRDGNTIYAFGAHNGTWVPVAADAGAVLAIGGEVATAHSPTTFRAFSVQHDQWGTMTVPSTASPILTGEFAAVISGSSIVAYSGLSGTFDQYTASGPLASPATDTSVLAFQDGPNVVCYGSGRGTFETLAASSTSLLADASFAFIVAGNEVTPFSGLTGVFGDPIQGTFTLETADVVGFATGSSASYAYSPIGSEFVAVPPVGPLHSVTLVRSTAAYGHSGGYDAFSARHSDYVTLTIGNPGSLLAPASGANFVVMDGPQIANIFDTRLDRFTTITSSSPLTVQSFRHTLIAHDGTRAYGFGQPTGRIDEVALNGPVQILDVASSIGFVVAGQELHVYSVQGSLSYEGRFPEFSRAIQLGTPLRLHQVGPPGAALVMLVGAEPAFLDLGLLLGTLFIDPGALFSVPLPATIPADGLLSYEIALPALPALIGVVPQIQNFVVPPAAPPYLSTSVAPVLF
jgi:hypothetical protein